MGDIEKWGAIPWSKFNLVRGVKYIHIFENYLYLLLFSRMWWFIVAGWVYYFILFFWGLEWAWVWKLRVEADTGYIILQNQVGSGSVNSWHEQEIKEEGRGYKPGHYLVQNYWRDPREGHSLRKKNRWWDYGRQMPQCDSAQLHQICTEGTKLRKFWLCLDFL